MIAAITGEFLSTFSDHGILIDENVTVTTAYTTGAVRSADLQVQPSLTEKWQILGWTVRAHIGLFLQAIGGGQYHGRLGDLWGGLVVDADLPQSGAPFSGGAQFPPDLSTFAKIWDGGTDPIRRCLVLTDREKYQLAQLTYTLPQPVDVRPGSNLQMAVVLTPSLMGIGPGGSSVDLVVADAYYSVLYDDGRR